MSDEKPQFWFPAKRYGWGWGLPVRPAGWVVLGSYLASIFAAIGYFRPRNDRHGLIVTLVIATLSLIAICAWKSEKPLKWRWGDE